MDNKLQVLLTLLSMPAAVVWLNSAFYHATTAYMHRRLTLNTDMYVPSVCEWSCGIRFQAC